MDSPRILQLLPMYYLYFATSILRRAISFFSITKRLPSLVLIQDNILSLYFHYCGLESINVHIDEETQMHFWVPKTRRLDRTAVVLVHGFGGNSKWQWINQIKPFSRTFDVFIPDLVFFGKSKTRRQERSVEFQAKCVGEGLRRLGVNRFCVIGLSYGGFVAYKMAEMYEDRIEKVIIMSSGICCNEEQQKEILDRGGKDFLQILLPRRPTELMALMKKSMFKSPIWAPEFLLRDFIQVMYSDHRKERMEMLEELIFKKNFTDPDPVLSQRTLIIWGDKDEVFPLFLAYLLKMHLGENSKLEIVKDAGHACQLEMPNVVNKLILAFILEGENCL